MNNTIHNRLISLIFFLLISFPNLFPQSGSLDGRGGGIIAFTSDRDGQNEIYFMNADGSSQTRITHTAVEEYFLKWSPDGSKIAYRAGGGIYVINVLNISNGLVSEPELVIAMGGAVIGWMPDGRIIFDSPANGNWDIYIINVDGSNLINLTNNQETVFDPDVSPDGSKIVFTKGYKLWIMDIDGNNQYQLTTGQNDFAPAWSPDGNQIAFNSLRGDQQNIEITIINAGGTNRRFITESPYLDEFPSWSPEGTKITYESDVNNLEKIFVVNVDGTNTTQLTNTNFNDGGPDWFPIEFPTAINEGQNSIPQEFKLYQNYPNPFNPSTKISYSIPTSGFVILEIFDMLGKKVKTLVNEYQTAGNYSIDFDAQELPSNVYLYKLQAAENFSEVKKMVLIR